MLVKQLMELTKVCTYFSLLPLGNFFQFLLFVPGGRRLADQIEKVAMEWNASLLG